MSNISDWFAWDCEGFKNQFVPFQGIMGTKNGNLWCQKPKKKGLYSQFQTSAAPLIGRVRGTLESKLALGKVLELSL